MSEGEEPTIPKRHRGCKAGDNCKGIACNQCWSFKVSSKNITLKSKPKAMSVPDDNVPSNNISNEDDVVSSNGDVVTAPDKDTLKMSQHNTKDDNNAKERALSKTHLFNSLTVSEEMKPILLSLSTPEQVEKFRMETGLYREEEEEEEEDTPVNVDDTTISSTIPKKSKKMKWWKKKNSTKSKIKAAADNGKIYESSNTNKQPLYTALDEYYDQDSNESKGSSEKKEEQIVVLEEVQARSGGDTKSKEDISLGADVDELKPDVDADTNEEKKKAKEEKVKNVSNKVSSSLTSPEEYVVGESNTKDNTFCTSVAMALESGVEGGLSNIEDLLPPVKVNKEKIDLSSSPDRSKVSRKTKRPKTKRTRENLSYMSIDDHYDNTSDDLSDNAVPPPLPEMFVSENHGVSADGPTKFPDKEIKKETEEVDKTICEDDFLDHLIESIMEVKEKNINYISGCDAINKDALTEAVPEVVSTCWASSKDINEDKINSSKEAATVSTNKNINKAIPKNNVLSRSKLIGNVNTGPSKKNSIKPFNSLNEGEAEAVEMVMNNTAVSTPTLSQSKPQKKTRLAMAREKLTKHKESVSKQDQVVPPDVLKSITIIPAASTVLEQQDDIQAEEDQSACPSRVSDTSRQLKRERLRAIMDKRKSGNVRNENKKPEEKSSPAELTEFKKLLTSKRLFNPVKSKSERGQGLGAAFGGDMNVETPEDRIKAALMLPSDTSKDSNENEENVAPKESLHPMMNQVDDKPEEDNDIVGKLTAPTKDEGNGEKKKTSPLDSCGMMGLEIANDLKEAIITPAKNLCTSEGIYPRWCFSDNADEQVVQEGDRQEVLVMWQPTTEDTDSNQESNEPSTKPPTLAEKTLNSIFPKEENQVRSPSPTLTDISSESSSEDVNPEVKNVIAEALAKARLQKKKKSAEASV